MALVKGRYKFPFHFAKNSPRHKARRLWRRKLGSFLESNRVQIAIVALIFLDLIIVIIELFLEEHYKSQCAEEHEIPHVIHRLENALGIITLVLLGIFEFEILLLLFAFGRDFFKHPLYVFDAIVITVSIIVEVVFRDTAGALLVVFRLWRVVRIGHGIAISVETHDKKKYKELKSRYRKKVEDNKVYLNQINVLRNRMGEIAISPPNLSEVSANTSSIFSPSRSNEIQSPNSTTPINEIKDDISDLSADSDEDNFNEKLKINSNNNNP